MASEAPINRSLVVESKPSAIVGVCGRILSELQRHNFSQDDVFAVHLALEEAFINAIRHGNKMDATKKVRIDYSVASDKVDVSMTDQGDGFDPEAVPDPRIGQNIYKPEGRGLFLINSYMDVVKFNQSGNSVRMIKYRQRPPQAESRSQVHA